MIERDISRWHEYLLGNLPDGLDDLLDEDVVFYSPIVHTPQEGKEITKLYLQAAAAGLAGTAQTPTAVAADRRFRYTKQVVAGDTAVLEFETTVQDKYVNGVDIIRCNAAGRIVEFRVMIRPLQAVHIVHQQMKTDDRDRSAEPLTAATRRCPATPRRCRRHGPAGMAAPLGRAVRASVRSSCGRGAGRRPGRVRRGAARSRV
jgi:hypothetical protein